MIKRVGLNNERGFTLTELIASIFLIGLLGYGFVMAMLQFVIGYQETRDYLALQHQMLNVFDIIRHGYVKEGLNTEQALIGLLTAQEVVLSHAGNDITKIPVGGNLGVRHWARITHDSNSGQMFITAQYGYQHLARERIFPAPGRVDMIGRENKFMITELRFENLTPDLDSARLVNIQMTGRVRFREMGRGQDRAEDLRRNVRFVKFENTVFLGNSIN